jgi:hypothetical protein
MSQYPPSPYSAPQPQPAHYAYAQYDAYFAPARRAGLLMFILGGIGMTCALCMGIVAAVAPMERLIAESGVALPSASETGVSPETLMRLGYGIIAGGALLFSLLILILAVFVRRGSAAATITAIVIDSIIILALGINTIGSLVQVLRNPSALIGVVIVVAMLAGFVLLLVWLIQALRAAATIKAMQIHYQQQYWQYQQQQQMYAYGYAQQQQQPAPQVPTQQPSSDQNTSHRDVPPENPFSPR